MAKSKYAAQELCIKEMACDAAKLQHVDCMVVLVSFYDPDNGQTCTRRYTMGNRYIIDRLVTDAYRSYVKPKPLDLDGLLDE